MRQRATIAMALACNPALLIADEPTTALDVTIQAQILDLLGELQDERGMGILFVTHNLGVVAEIADRVAVMYAGSHRRDRPGRARSSPIRAIPTRIGLMRSVPRLGQATALKAAGTPLPTIAGNVPSPRRCCPRAAPSRRAARWRSTPAARPCRRCSTVDADASRAAASAGRSYEHAPAPFSRSASLTKHFAPDAFSRGPVVKALQDVSFDIPRGQVVGLVGESGSGKTTIGRSVLRLIEPTSGEMRFDGMDIVRLARRRAAPPAPQHAVYLPGSLREPVAAHDHRPDPDRRPRYPAHRHARRADGSGPRRRLPPSSCRPTRIDRYAHEFSGGQRQRIGIARALTLEPEFIVADEPVSALDVSIQAQIINLLRDLQLRLGLTMLFISHDLAVVEYICDTVIVLYLGRIMEIAPAAELYASPQHPYTRALLSAIPSPDPTAAPERADPQGRHPEPGQPAIGLRLPHPLPVRDRGLRRRRARHCARPSAGHLKACIRDDIPA